MVGILSTNVRNNFEVGGEWEGNCREVGWGGGLGGMVDFGCVGLGWVGWVFCGVLFVA